MLNKKAQCAFGYCGEWSLHSVARALSSGQCKARVCYATTQSQRMYLVLNGKRVEYTPFVRHENQWIPAKLMTVVTPPSAVKAFRSQHHLETILREDFFKQFPHAEECYYENFPAYDEVLTTITSEPYEETLIKARYIYSKDEDTLVEEADGILTIFVDEGEYMVPYDKTTLDGSEHLTLQVDRGLLHPESKLLYWNEKFWEVVDCVASFIRQFSWSGFRRFVDRVIQ